MLPQMLSSLLVALPLASCASLSVSIEASQGLPNVAALTSSTHAVLLGPPGVRYDVPLRKDNTFQFFDLSDASYLLTIYSRDHAFVPLRIDVDKSAPGSTSQTLNAWQTFRGNEWSNKGPSYGSGEDHLTVVVQPAAKREYYQQRAGFNLIDFVKSPMILMALVSVVLIFVMPYMMDNMDADTKAEMEEMASKSPLTGSEGAASQLQNFDLAGWMAGKPSNSGTSTPASGGGGAKRK